MKDPRIDHMAITITRQEQSGDLLDALSSHHFPVTVIDAHYDTDQPPTTTLVAGVSQQQLPFFFTLIREHCPALPRPHAGLSGNGHDEVIEVRVGGAVVFVIPVQAYLNN